MHNLFVAAGREHGLRRGGRMGRMEGKVALVTGAARGQGRAHAVRLAQEGADVIAVDICRQLDTVPYPMATPEDLAETARLVEELDRRVVAREADVRDFAALQAATEDGIAALGRLDAVVANAGISTQGLLWELTEQQWSEMQEVCLAGVWRTIKATVPRLIEQGDGGSIVLTGSTASLKGFGGVGHYSAAKHGVLGLMRSLVNEVRPHSIRVNTVVPTSTNTPMIQNDAMRELFGVASDAPLDDFAEAFQAMHTLPVPWAEPSDIANAALFLLSDEARYVTGTVLQVDAGFHAKVG
jgi:SDR family mycofactocin-dependent oxidoreductase